MQARRTKRRATSLVEVVISTMLVGLLMVGALNCLGAVVKRRTDVSDAGLANHLLRQLMSEILEQEYKEPVDTLAFGVESPESATSRAAWDDVDDYHLWSASPPQDRSGAALPIASGWRREAQVEWCDPSDPASNVGSDQGLKRITVTVLRDGNVLAQESALRSDKYPAN